MALKIKESQNAFIVEGIINETTVKQFKNHFKTLIIKYS